MSSLTNQSASTKSMTGLSDTYSTNIVANTVEVIDNLTVDTGATITLPANSISDTALSTNVALLNRNPQTFTGANTFDQSTIQSLGTFLIFRAVSGGSVSRINQQTTGLLISNNNSNQVISLQTRTTTSAVIGLQCSSGNSTFIQGESGNRLTITGANTPVITNQAGTNSNDLSIANTAWVVTKLGSYALLAPSGIQVYTGSHQFPTQLISDNSTLVATTAYVQNQGYATTASLSAYALLAGTQTFTGANTFNTGTTTFNALTVHNSTLRNFQSTQAVFPGDFRMLDSTQTYLTQMYQTGTTCVVDAPFASSRIQFSTRDAANAGGVTNLIIENKNHIVLQGSASEIDITGTAVTLNGVCSFTNTTTPTISSAIPTPDNSTKIATTAFVKAQGYLTSATAATLYAVLNGTQTFIGSHNFPTQAVANNSTLCATTAFVKNQGYATTASLSSYALLTATQTFTGQQTFTDIIPTSPILIKNTTSTKSGGFIISGNTSYNSINNTDDFAVIAFGSGINTGILNLTTWAAGSCGIKIDATSIKFNAGLSCNYNTLTPVPALNVYDIGYSWLIAGATFTAWTGFTTPQNVATINWNGIGPRNKGVWRVDIILTTQNTTPPISMLIWTDVSGTDDTLNLTCMHMEDKGAYGGGVQAQIMRMSFNLEVTTIPSTYYLNYRRLSGSGTGLSADTVNSRITFTRIG